MKLTVSQMARKLGLSVGSTAMHLEQLSIAPVGMRAGRRLNSKNRRHDTVLLYDSSVVAKVREWRKQKLEKRRDLEAYDKIFVDVQKELR